MEMMSCAGSALAERLLRMAVRLHPRYLEFGFSNHRKSTWPVIDGEGSLLLVHLANPSGVQLTTAGVQAWEF